MLECMSDCPASYQIECNLELWNLEPWKFGTWNCGSLEVGTLGLLFLVLGACMLGFSYMSGFLLYLLVDMCFFWGGLCP